MEKDKYTDLLNTDALRDILQKEAEAVRNIPVGQEVNEAIKLILGGGEPLINRLLLFDAWKLRFRELKLRKDPACHAGL